MFKILNTAGVRYLVVGGYAFGFHVEPRTTKDLDIWVDPSPENVRLLYKALAEFGAPLTGVTEEDFRDPDLVYQIGVPPNRIDIIMGLEDISFDEAWKNKFETTYNDETVYVVGRDDLIKIKRTAGRPQDLEDVHGLEASRKYVKSKKRTN
jgi:hypothetical protein